MKFNIPIHRKSKPIVFRNKTAIIIGVTCGVLLASCHAEKQEHHAETKFQITSPLRKDTAFTKEYVCQIHSIQHIELRALEKGYLQNIYVDEGQFVKQGQLMFQTMPMLYEAELQKAQAEVNFAEIEYQNTKQLTDSNIVSASELALARATLDKAKAELALSQVHLNFTKIIAPFDGIIDRFHVRLGSLLEEGEFLTTLSDNSSLWVYFNVPEAEYLDLKTLVRKDSSMQVRLLMANNKVFSHTGEVTTVEADFNNETGNIAFRATFPNPEALLRHGETGNILMDIPLENALLIPQKATFEILDKKYVFVVDENGVIASRRITVTTEMTHLYVVQDGLEEGDKILLEGLRKVRDGDKISQEYVEPKSALSQLDLYAE